VQEIRRTGSERFVILVTIAAKTTDHAG